jgi:hypothetical protein
MEILRRDYTQFGFRCELRIMPPIFLHVDYGATIGTRFMFPKARTILSTR